MKPELLSQPELGALSSANQNQARVIGETVFEALAIDAATAIAAPDGSKEYDFTNSLTRIPDGQTVPDER